MQWSTICSAVSALILLGACGVSQGEQTAAATTDTIVSEALKTSSVMENEQAEKPTTPIDTNNLDTATLGAGCFWCVEAVFTELQGVHTVVSGYSGGHVDNPTYKAVCSETTGHAEVAQITYDPGIVSFDELLEVFWQTHDPTTRNRQGNDVGTQYRSAVFYHNEEQREKAEHYKKQLNASGAWANPVVTEIVPLEKFWPAEDYHQEYYANNPNQGYCRYVVGPKVEKFRKAFAHKLKP